MKITSVECYLGTGAIGGFVTMKINTDSGIYGWGEAGLAYGKSTEAAFGQCQDFGKLILGMDPFNTEEIWEHLHRHTFWGMGGGVVITSAMAAIDTACWDIKGKALGVPVYKLLGGKTNPKLRAYASQQDTAPALAAVEREMETLAQRKEKLLDLALSGALSNEEFKQRNEACNARLTELEAQQKSLRSADKTLEERIRCVEELRRTIEQQWKSNCGFSREMSKALVDRIVVDADESRTKISLDIYLTLGREYRAEYARQGRKSSVLSFGEIHISQAQVSRLEKGALAHIREGLA